MMPESPQNQGRSGIGFHTDSLCAPCCDVFDKIVKTGVVNIDNLQYTDGGKTFDIWCNRYARR